MKRIAWVLASVFVLAAIVALVSNRMLSRQPEPRDNGDSAAESSRMPVETDSAFLAAYLEGASDSSPIEQQIKLMELMESRVADGRAESFEYYKLVNEYEEEIEKAKNSGDSAAIYSWEWRKRTVLESGSRRFPADERMVMRYAALNDNDTGIRLLEGLWGRSPSLDEEIDRLIELTKAVIVAEERAARFHDQSRQATLVHNRIREILTELDSTEITAQRKEELEAELDRLVAESNRLCSDQASP